MCGLWGGGGGGGGIEHTLYIVIDDGFHVFNVFLDWRFTTVLHIHGTMEVDQNHHLGYILRDCPSEFFNEMCFVFLVSVILKQGSNQCRSATKQPDTSGNTLHRIGPLLKQGSNQCRSATKQPDTSGNTLAT